MNSHKMPMKQPPRQVKLSWLVQFPHVVWSLMYHVLAKNGEEPLIVAKGKKPSASFDFTAVDAFSLFVPNIDLSGLEKRMQNLAQKH